MNEDKSKGPEDQAIPAPVHRVVMQLESWIGSELQSPGWDSYGATPITNETIETAIKIARLIVGNVENVDWVQPCPDGSIEFSDHDNSVWIRVSLSKESA